MKLKKLDALQMLFSVLEQELNTLPNLDWHSGAPHIVVIPLQPLACHSLSGAELLIVRQSDLGAMIHGA